MYSVENIGITATFDNAVGLNKHVAAWKEPDKTKCKYLRPLCKVQTQAKVITSN